MKNPSWWNKDYDSSWERVKHALARDWEQTKHDLGSKSAPDLGQNVSDTVKQAAGKEPPRDFSRYEAACRYGYGAQVHYKDREWGPDIEGDLQRDYGGDWSNDREAIRRAYEFKGY